LERLLWKTQRVPGATNTPEARKSLRDQVEYMDRYVKAVGEPAALLQVTV